MNRINVGEKQKRRRETKDRLLSNIDIWKVARVTGVHRKNLNC